MISSHNKNIKNGQSKIKVEIAAKIGKKNL